MKWKKGSNGWLETADGRFYVEGHWNKKPGYYLLVDTKTNRRESGTKLKDLKARVETLLESEKSSGPPLS